jgi:Predicted thioesterase involved in non-ribosomal peptide biosynthesis
MSLLKQLFIFPHAGGSEISYVSLQKQLSPFFEVVIISYPGRGRLIAEPHKNSVEELAQYCTGQIKANLKARDYFFLGHSFGSLVAFEVLRLLNRQGEKLPLAAFMSGREAPSTPRKMPLKHLLSDAGLVAYIDSIGGIPAELIDNADFLSFFLPIIRNDLKMNEIYEYAEDDKISVPFVLLNGKVDEGVTKEGLANWQNETIHPIKQRFLDGGHFYLLTNPEFVDNIIYTYNNI